MKNKSTPIKDFLNKIKHGEINYFYVVMFVVLAVVIRYWGEDSISMLQKQVPEVTKTDIVTEELDHYLVTRQEYIDQQINVDPGLIESSDFLSQLDKGTHEWFLVRNWRPDRYFYVENRVKKILEYMKKREINLAQAQNMNTQVQQLLATTDAKSPQIRQKIAELRRQIQDIRYYADREIRQAGVSVQEENLIKAKKYALGQLGVQ